METIRNYLENLFQGLPRTERILRLRDEMLSNMEERYSDLKAQGRTENEAVGIVISEFGNIDELLDELNLRKEKVTLPEATPAQVDEYFERAGRSARLIAWGVFLCVMGPAVQILFGRFFEAGLFGVPESAASALSLILLFLCVVPGAVLLTYGGMRLESGAKLERETHIPAAIGEKLRQQYVAFRSSFIRAIAIGVGLCVLSPVPLIAIGAVSGDYGVYGIFALLLLAGCGAQLFIRSGMLHGSYQKLLKIGDYEEKPGKAMKAIGIVAAIVWPLSAVVFLFLGFVCNLWRIAWIIYPIAGLLFGIFCRVYTLARKTS